LKSIKKRLSIPLWTLRKKVKINNTIQRRLLAGIKASIKAKAIPPATWPGA